jgi:hypothetical protein
MVFYIAQQDNVAVNKKTGWEYDQGNSRIFIHELDRLDYDLFSKVNGFEIVLKKNQKKLQGHA